MPLKANVVLPATVLKLVPVSVTVVPVVPLPGEIPVSVGKGANENSSLDGALVLPSTVIVSVTGDVPAGLVTRHSVLELPQDTSLAVAAPNFTVMWSLRLVPEIATVK